MKTVFISLIILLSCFNITYSDDPEKNNNLNKPIVGIITNPSPINYDLDKTPNQATINYSYVAWLNEMGAKSLPLHWNYTDDELNTIIPMLNGILLQGGARDLIPPTPGSYEERMETIINIANKQGIPVWFTCQGFEFLYYIISQYDNKVLDKKVAWGQYLPLTMVKNYDTTKSYMFKYFSSNDFVALETTPSTIHYHNLGVDTSAHKTWPKLDEILIITSTGQSDSDGEFIGTVESKDFTKNKYYGVQFHPEKTNYEADKQDKLNLKNMNTVVISQKIALGFMNDVNLSRANHSMSMENQVKYGVILPQFTSVSHNKTLYFFVDKKLLSSVSEEELKFLEK